jgi:4-aminobutyrate aminotransferase/(S)-3-amino-2-methylpropionate transaminase
MAQPVQQRILKTAIPGPESTKRHEARKEAFSDGFGITLPEIGRAHV